MATLFLAILSVNSGPIFYSTHPEVYTTTRVLNLDPVFLLVPNFRSDYGAELRSLHFVIVFDIFGYFWLIDFDRFGRISCLETLFFQKYHSYSGSKASKLTSKARNTESAKVFETMTKLYRV